jgi:creatinine amidohydrolase
MLWENLSAKNFMENVKASGEVCLLPIGVLEKHGDHLPVGTDMITGQAVCKKAAEIEKAVVFPYYFLGQIAEAKHYPGCIAASHRLIMDTLLEMCDEIHRNGFKKIIICSSHGGNHFFLPFFLQQMPGLNRPYNVYSYYISTLNNEQRKLIVDTAKYDDLGQHAGLTETATIMYLRPELVDMSVQNPKDSVSKDRLADLRSKSVYSGYNWYAEYPYHFAGDPSLATPELGKIYFDIVCENLAEVIRAVKADDVSEKLINEYNMAAKKHEQL